MTLCQTEYPLNTQAYCKQYNQPDPIHTPDPLYQTKYLQDRKALYQIKYLPHTPDPNHTYARSITYNIMLDLIPILDQITSTSSQTQFLHQNKYLRHIAGPNVKYLLHFARPNTHNTFPDQYVSSYIVCVSIDMRGRYSFPTLFC